VAQENVYALIMLNESVANNVQIFILAAFVYLLNILRAIFS